ncbi:PP2C family protein-serine/threonine phosphatase [Oerskovia turbata]
MADQAREAAREGTAPAHAGWPLLPAELSSGRAAGRPAGSSTPPAATEGLDYRAVFAALSIPKVVLSPDLTVLDVNNAYLDMLGVPASTLVGRPLERFFTHAPDDGPAIERVVGSLRRVLQTGRIELLEPLRIDIPGERPGEWVERHWLMTNIPVHDAGGRVAALVHRAEDVTAIVQSSRRDAAGDRAQLDAAVVGHAMHLGSSVGRFHETFDRERRAAVALQDSILTPPAQPDGLCVDVRYRPASRDLHVGGDWYDAFVLSSGSAFVVVGDVAGHDIAAAAAMGQLRGVMRGIAYDSGDSPAQILDRTERTTTGLGVPTIATVAAAHVRPPGPDGGRVLTWACAGHPPPLLLRADGTARLLSTRADRLLGLGAGPARTDHTTVLRPGDTLLLYTDGLVERRDAPLREALGRLPTIVEDAVRTSRAGLLDALLARLVPHSNDDDVALLSVEVLPPDTPPR